MSKMEHGSRRWGGVGCTRLQARQKEEKQRGGGERGGGRRNVGGRCAFGGCVCQHLVVYLRWYKSQEVFISVESPEVAQ